MSKLSSGPRKRLRRGLWSPVEDAKLINHVSMYGHGCWSHVAKLAGIDRGGKSCRLRWLNYLRPDLKRDAFSHEEEDLIVRLHSILGNRWSQIAARLPGRTDNEVKNFWHSYIKKKLRLRGIDPVTHRPVIVDSGNGAAVAAAAATRSTVVFSESELVLSSAGQRMAHVPQATAESYMYVNMDGASASAQAPVVVGGGCSHGSLTPSRYDTLHCLSTVVHPAVIPVESHSSTVGSTADPCPSGTVGAYATVEQWNNHLTWQEPGWISTCTDATADHYGPDAATDELDWCDCVFNADNLQYQLQY